MIGLLREQRLVARSDHTLAIDPVVLDFHECTRNYPVTEKLEKPLEPWFRTVWVKFGPDMLGFPTRRTRAMSFLMNRDKFAWVGPDTHNEIQADFEAMFGRKIKLTGDSYLAADDSLVMDYYKDNLNKRHVYPKSIDPFSIQRKAILRHLLVPGMLMRLQAYEKKYRELNGSLDAYIVDLVQSVNTRGDCSGQEFPTQVTHGTFYSITKERLILGCEQLFANGWFILKKACDIFGSPLMPLMMHTLKDHELKFLSGNSMALKSLMAWFLYIASHTVRVEAPKMIEEFTLSQQSQ